MASDGEISCTNDPNFAVIYSFLKVFGKLYSLEIPTLTKLQELVENTQEVLEPLKELHLRLLRRALRSVQSNRWERGLIKFCHQHGHHQEAWEVERFSYKKASTTVKLKVLKLLLEYQFTCHPKFKTAVNAISCKDLRLEPIGRDKSGCVYWLQVDHEANLCLYREDQDEETWQLVARSREELVQVIAKLKSGEEICPSAVNNANEDSNSGETFTKDESTKAAQEEDNEEEEFLSPESESEHDEDEPKSKNPIENETKVDNLQKDQDNEGESSKHETSTELVDEHKEVEEDPPSPKRKRSESPPKIVSDSKEKDKVEFSDNFKEGDRNLEKEECPVKPETPSSLKAESANVKAEDNSSIDDSSIPKDKLENLESKSVSPKEIPDTSEIEPVSIEKANRPVSPETNNKKIIDPETKPDSPKGTSDNPEEKAVSPERDSDSSKDKPKSPENKPETDNNKQCILEDQLDIVEDKTDNTIKISEKLEDNPENSDNIDYKPKSPKQENSEISKDSLKETSDEVSNEKNTENDDQDQKTETEVSEAIEEPVMIVTGEGNGADCESFYLGEEICEPVMFFYGEGCGYDNDTGNPEAVERDNEVANESGEENGDEERINGRNHEIMHCKLRSSRNVKFRNKTPPVNKRALKKQSADPPEALKPDTKKHCIRNADKSESSNSTDRDPKRESSVNEKTTDSETPSKNNVKKGRNKMKKKLEVTRKLKVKQTKEKLNSVVEADNGQDSKTSIIEKRKSSLSSEEQDEQDQSEKEREKSPDKEIKIEDALPPKKLRLDTPESDAPHSKETVDTVDDVNNTESKNQSDENTVANTPAPSKRKKIRARKGKLRKKVQIKVEDDDGEKSDDDKASDNEVSKAKNKCLKRSLLETTVSDKNKSESQSEGDVDEPATSGKRLKMKPKKMNMSLRKSLQSKADVKHSSDESEEETLYSLAGKKSKKVLKKKAKSKEVKKEPAKVESDGDTPVRQSRRIAQLKIREEAERRHQEEVALRELKMIHTKKTTKDDEEEEEWRASGKSSSDSDKPARVSKKKQEWRAADSTDEASDTDEPLFDHHDHPEPDLEFNKSDHEFSPESDLESGEPSEPLKRARTLLHEEKDSEGFCQRCGSGEQPEWILLCDRCDAGYHGSCLKPLLFLVPEGDWYCPPCSHEMLIESLEKELVKYDELLVVVEAERERKRLEEPPPASDHEKEKEKESSDEGSSGWSSSSSGGAVYRLRARRQLPVSYRAQEYDRLISSAIKEEYVEPTTSAGNQGRGKDISTIIEAAEEEKLKAEREAIEQGKPVEKKAKKKQRRKPRKLNSLEVPSEDDDETDEDFKDTGLETSSEDISSSAERDDSSSRSVSSDDLPIRRTCRPQDKKERSKMTESSPEVKKKKKGVFEDSSSESGENGDWNKKKKSKPKQKKRDKSSTKKCRKRTGLKQYDAEGNVIRARVTYGGLSADDGENDWSPKHRTRQKKINYTEMPNTESEDEMHKSSGKHMPDSSDEFHITESELSSDSDGGSKRTREDDSEDRRRTLEELIRKTAVVPLEKLPEDVTKAKTEELQAHLAAQEAESARPARGRGSRGARARGTRGPRGRSGRGRGAAPGDPVLAGLVGLKIKDLGPDGAPRPLDAEREKKRQEREAKLAEKEARKMERIQKKEEKEKMREQKAKEREEKRLARLAQQENKRLKKEKPEFSPMAPGMGFGGELRPYPPAQYAGPGPGHPQAQPRLQVRAELRGALAGAGERGALRGEGTLSVAGSPQPYKPPGDEPSVITRMPHALNHQYGGSMLYGNGGGYARPGGYMHHPGLAPQQLPRHQLQYPPQYYQMRGPPGYPPGARPGSGPPGVVHQQRHPPGHQGPPGPSQGPPGHGPPGTLGHQGPPGHGVGHPGAPGTPGHGPPGSQGHGPPGTPGQGPPNHGPLGTPGHGPLRIPHGPPSHGPPGTPNHGPSGTPGHGLPGHGLPGTPGHRPPSHGQPGTPGQGPPGHGPPGTPHGPLGHGPPGGPSHLPPGHGPPGTPGHGPPRQMGPHGPYGPPRHSPGPQGPHPGHPGQNQAIPGHPGMPRHLLGPQGHPGPPVSRAPPGHPGPHNLQSTPRLSSALAHTSSPHVTTLGHSPSPHGMPLFASHLLRNPTPPHNLPPRPPVPTSHPSPTTTPPRGPVPHPGLPVSRPPVPSSTSPPSSPASNQNEPVKIKAEVKTEPEYHSPSGSPRPASPRDDTPRHPKIKHTENKERRPRFPLGPYAPQYGAYGPYAPPGPVQQPPRLHAPYLPTPERPMERPPDPQYLAHLQRMRAPFPMNYPPPPRSLPPGSLPPGLPPHQYHQYSECSALEKQLSTPVAIPQMSREPEAPRMATPERPPSQPRAPEKPMESGSAAPDNINISGPAAPDHINISGPAAPDHINISGPAAPDHINVPPKPPEPSVANGAPIKVEIKEEIREAPPREESTGVFGGLVSYFSSQREDDMDA